MKMAKNILILLGIAIFAIYAAPLVARIFNLGNLFGMLLGAVLFGTGLCLPRLCTAWQTKLGKISLSAIGVLALAFFVVFFVTLGHIIHAACTYPEAQNKPLVVLGCQVKGDTPSLQLYKRTMAGVEYLKQNPEAMAVLCGGQGTNEWITEAECMKRIMVQNGIDERRLILEGNSTTTEENLRFAADLLEQNGLKNDIVVATSDYHCYRAEVIAAKLGMSAESVPAFADYFTRPTYYTREVFGVWQQWFLR